MLKKPAVPWIIFLVLRVSAVQAQSQAPSKTVLDGVYSDAQATRGQATYTAHCRACHGDALEGISAPELTGNRFIERWREDMLDTIYSYIRQTCHRVAGRMPNQYRTVTTWT